MLAIGFIGLGQMGFPMAKNLVSKLKPTQTYVFDTQPVLVKQFQKEASNVIVAKNPAEVAALSSLVVTMLPESQHVQAVYLGDKGLLSSTQPGSLFIDSSTIDPTVSEQVYRACKAKQTQMVDAPVSGGTNGAKAGTLTFMVGAEEKVLFEKVKPILQCMGKNVVYCGTNGKGQVAKIVNNMLLGISMIASSEAMNLGTRLGMDPKLLASIINTSSGRCWSTDTYNPCPGVMENVPASRDYEGGFGNALMAKDLGLAVTAAQTSKSTIFLGSIAVL